MNNRDLDRWITGNNDPEDIMRKRGLSREEIAHIQNGGDEVILKPYQLVTSSKSYPRIKEVINKPFVGDDGLERVGIRSPGDPTTYEVVPTSELSLLHAECTRDSEKFEPVVSGEFTNCHVDCPRCGRAYYAEHTITGKFVRFYSDRPLKLFVPPF